MPFDIECIAFKSACIPAPPPESEPAIVYTMLGLIVGILILISLVIVVDGDEAANANTDGTSVVKYRMANDISK